MSQQSPKFPDARVRLVGEDGNAVSIIGRTLQALREAGATAEERNEFASEAMSGDYDNVLATVMRWATVDELEEDIEGLDF